MKRPIVFFYFFLIWQSLFCIDLYFIDQGFSHDPFDEGQNFYSLYKFDWESGSLQYIRKFPFHRNSLCFYSEYENRTYIIEPGRQPDREQAIFTIEKRNGEFIAQKQDLRPITENIIVDRESSPLRVLVPSEFQPNYIIDRDCYLIDYDYRFQYKNGTKVFGPKYCEIRNGGNDIVYSFYLKPHDGFDEDRQFYFNFPQPVGDSKVVYDNRLSHKQTFLYDYVEDTLISRDGNLHGVSYLGKSFVLSDSQSTKVYDVNFTVLNDLSAYTLARKVHIYGNILFSYSPYVPGWYWPRNILVYDLEKDVELYYEENSALLNSGDFRFLGFYE